MASETETPKRKWSVGRIVLILSLALNLLVVGLVAGALLHRHQLPDRPPRIADLGFGPYVRSLSREDREALGTAFKAEEGNFRERRETLRRQFNRAQSQLFPLGQAQERIVSSIHFVNRYGAALIERLVSDSTLDTSHHWIIAI